MKTIRAIIIDDEPIAIEVIRELVNQLAPDIAVVATATDGREAVSLITALTPDLVFLDINLPYLRGDEVLRQVSGKPVQVVFTTGDPLYQRRQGMNPEAEYLDKPVDPAEFLAVISKVRNKHKRT